MLPASPGLVIFTIHSLFESVEEIARGVMDPQQGVTVAMFRALLANLRDHGCHFISPNDLLAGLDPGERYAMITFDDGYANNRRALPTMEEFQAPAVFFIASNYVRTGKPFWWDVLYRELLQRQSEDHLDDRRAALKRLCTCEAEQQIIAEFGAGAFENVSDLDRPLTAGELADFASHPLVHIGNHTADHAILTNYAPAEMREQIGGAQDWLQTITGKVPAILAYPNGNVSGAVVQAAYETGLRLGVTVQAGRNSISGTRSRTGALLLKRYLLWGTRDLEAQCRVARSPFSLQATWAAIRSKASFTA